MVTAWLLSAAIARLTGASGVILLLAAAFVAMIFEAAAGWWASRAVSVRSIVGPSVVTVGDPCQVLVTIDATRRRRAPDRRTISLTLPNGAAAVSTSTHDHGDRDEVVMVECRFETPGLVDALNARVQVAGPAGLIWWRRTTAVPIDTVHVAPASHGPLLDIDRAANVADGSMAAERGNHDGEIDGVRAWRPGDSTSSVHWVSSLRTDELIVHDRTSATDQRWVVDAPIDDGVDDAHREDSAGRLRWTLDEGHRQGHEVAVRTADGSHHPVTDADDAAVWAARVAHNDSASKLSVGLLRRQIHLSISSPETSSTITPTARWSAAAAAFASMAMLVGAVDGTPIVSVLVLGAVAVGAGVSLFVARRSGKRPLVMQVAIIAAILVALGAIAVQASGVDGLLAALRGPLPNVLMLLVVLHGFEVIDRRTLRVHLAITFVIACYGAGLRIDDALGWWLLAWATPLLISFLTASTTTSPTSPSARASRAGRTPSVTPRSSIRWVTAFAALSVATLALLSLIPIPDGPARLGLPALSSGAPRVGSPGGLAAPDGSSPPPADGDATPGDRGSIGNVVGYPGFTESLDTSVRGDLGDDLVMRVRAPEPAFWRGQTFTEFDGRTWTVSPELGDPRTGPVIDVPPTVGDALGTAVPTAELVQTYYVEQDLPNVVFAAARPVQVVIDGSLWTRPDGALRSDVTLNAGSVYTVISSRAQVDAEILRSQGDLGAFFAGFRDAAGGDEIDPFLELPPSTTQRTIDLATRLRSPGESTYDTILSYEAWLGANTEYDLDAPVPAPGDDAVDDFLFESQRGFCEQIASTLVVMLRSQGVPARLATGYVPGERDRVSGVWNVVASDAHAWVEVWFPTTGWQAFDPTAEVPLAADAGNATVGGDLIAATVSSIASHGTSIAMVALLLGACLVAIRLEFTARHRRRRGRWGLLQDRFADLAGPEPATVPRTNPAIAATVDEPDRAAAHAVADELDRAAFDPGWIDDDERYERTKSALATLQGARR